MVSIAALGGRRWPRHRRLPMLAARVRRALVLAIAGAALIVLAPRAGAVERRAADTGELRAALQAARPGDVVVMRNGVWKDVAIDFKAEATARAPVRLRAQTPGGVVLSGNSRLTFLAPH